MCRANGSFQTTRNLRELRTLVGNSNLELGVQMGQQGKLSATTNCHNQAEAGWRTVAWRGQTSTINCFETDWAVLKRCNNAVAGTGSGVVMCQVSICICTL